MSEINQFLWVNFVYMVFFQVALIKFSFLPDLDFEFELIVFILYYIVEIIRMRKILPFT